MSDIDYIDLKKNDNSKIITPRDGDIGYDIVASSEPNIVGTYITKNGLTYYSHIDYLEYKTGLFIQHKNDNFFSLLFPRSSISNYRLALANSVGVIDTSYTGEIICKFRYTYSPKDFIVFDDSIYFMINDEKIYHKGDKIGQLVFMKKTTSSINIVEQLEKTVRNDGGFGSTGK